MLRRDDRHEVAATGPNVDELLVAEVLDDVCGCPQGDRPRVGIADLQVLRPEAGDELASGRGPDRLTEAGRQRNLDRAGVVRQLR